MMTSLIFPDTLIQALVVCAVTGTAFLIMMPIAGKLMGLPEILAFYEKLSRRLKLWQHPLPRS